MKKSEGAATQTGLFRRVLAAFAIAFLVASLISSGVDVFASVMETDDVERAPATEAVLVAERASPSGDAIRLASRQPVAQCCDCRSPFLTTHLAPLGSQVLSRLRNSGIQRATHPTGPPAVHA